MSRQQWGHGYWQGVNDANSGKVKPSEPSAEDLTMLCMTFMVDHNRGEYDSSLFPVWGLVASIGENDAKKVYDYSLKNQLIGDGMGDSWTDDYFLLPAWTEKECEEIRLKIRLKYVKEEGEAE